MSSLKLYLQNLSSFPHLIVRGLLLFFKKLIKQRGIAFANGNFALYKSLRNRVNRVRKSLQKQFYLNKIHKLKTENPSAWWKNIKSLMRYDTANSDVIHLKYQSADIPSDQLSNVVNEYFVSVTQHIAPLDPRQLSDLRSSLSPLPDECIVSEYDVFKELSKIKLRKSVGPDAIPHRILKDLADVLAAPITAIINTSLRQGVVPDFWKVSRITVLPKVFPASNIESDIRPISVTNSLSKIAEKFVSRLFNRHFDEVADMNQFGCMKNRSTVHALIKVVNHLFKASDSSNNFIRILFVDFRKAFDLIDHNVLLQKFLQYEIPQHVLVWYLDFISNRSQFVRIGDSVSNVLTTNAGTPQGTITGPDDFKLLINDLNFDLEYIKYVDDTTAVSVSTDPNNLSLQHAADSLCRWVLSSGMIVNEGKTKEMIVYFGTKHDTDNVERISVNGKLIERVESFKLLGVYISSDLSWDTHIEYMLKKVAKRMYCIFCLIRIGAEVSEIISVYCSLIRSILEYACPVWHPGLTKGQHKNIERVQKRLIKMIYPSSSYANGLSSSGLERLYDRRERLTKDMFVEMKDPHHVLHGLLPARIQSSYDLRNSYAFQIPFAKATRYGRSIVPYCISKRY